MNLTYFEYLKELYIKKRLKPIEIHDLKYGQIQEEVDKWKFLKKIQIKTVTNEQDYIIFDMENEEQQSNNKSKNKSIIKEVFKITSKEEVDGFVWVEDPQTLKKKSVKEKLRKYFQNPSEIQKEGEDYMLQDFVVIEPDSNQNIQKENKFKQSLIDLTAGSLGE